MSDKQPQPPIFRPVLLFNVVQLVAYAIAGPWLIWRLCPSPDAPVNAANLLLVILVIVLSLVWPASVLVVVDQVYKAFDKMGG